MKRMRIVLLFLAVSAAMSTTSLMFDIMSPTGSGNTAIAAPSANALADIPGNYLTIMQKSGPEFNVAWNLGAGIAKVESDFGRGTAVGISSGINFAQCCRGPTQFNTENGNGPLISVSSPSCPAYTYRSGSTWDSYKVDGNGDGVFCIYDPQDAIPATFKMLAADGATTRAGWDAAVLAYNHSSAYVAQVIGLADSYAAAQAAGPPSTFGGTFIWPVSVAGSSVSSCYGPRTLRGVPSFHEGLDISQVPGTPVLAMAAGTVEFAGPNGGYGSNYVVIRHSGSLLTGYGHMMAMSVRPVDPAHPQTVKQGQEIGQVGSEGNSTGPHLHVNVMSSVLIGNMDPLKSGLTIPPGVPNPNGCS